MRPFPYPWQESCAEPPHATDPEQALRLIELAVCAIEKRYAEWQSRPGTPEELAVIRETISKLRTDLRRLQRLESRGAA